MKNLTPLLFLVLLPLMSCDELNDLADGKFDIIRTEVFEFDVKSGSTDNPDDEIGIMPILQTYNISGDPSIVDIVGDDLSAVEKVKILEVSYEFQNFSGNVDAKVTSKFNFSGPLVHNSEAVKMSEAVILRELYRIDADFQPMNNWISTNKFFGVEYSGSSTGNPVNFKVKLTVKFELTVNAKDE